MKRETKISLCIVILALFGFLFLNNDNVFACQCRHTPPPCGGIDGSAIVFIGEVIDISVDENAQHRRKNQFRIIESLKNVKSQNLTVASASRNECGYEFKQGEKYLVYAREYEGRIVTSGCTRTRPFSKAQDDLEILRELISKKPVTSRIFGDGRLLDNENSRVTQIAEAKIKARSADGKLYETDSDEFGNYRFVGLPAGKYALEIIHKGNFIKNFEVEISSTKQCAEQDFYFYSGGRINGKVVDNENKPVIGIEVLAKRLFLQPGDEKGYGFYRGLSDKDGNFDIEGLRAGTYVLGVNFISPIKKDFPFPATYYPQASTIESAVRLTITTDISIGEFKLQLPSKLTPRLITGTVIYPNGKPALEARVKVKEERTNWEMDEAEVDSKGRFTLQVFEGQSYYFYVYRDSHAWGMNRESKKIYIPKTGEIESLKLTVPLTKKEYQF